MIKYLEKNNIRTETINENSRIIIDHLKNNEEKKSLLKQYVKPMK